MLEDRAQIGLGAVVYAGCRIGREAIVASNSYVVSDIHAGSLAVGVPARVAGAASRRLTRPRQVALARRMLDELRELLTLHGVETAPLGDAGPAGFELTGAEGPARVLFAERLAAADVSAGAGETVVLTLELSGEPPEGCAVLDLLARRLHGEGGVVLDSVREFCRKRGIRFEPERMALPRRARVGREKPQRGSAPPGMPAAGRRRRIRAWPASDARRRPRIRAAAPTAHSRQATDCYLPGRPRCRARRGSPATGCAEPDGRLAWGA